MSIKTAVITPPSVEPITLVEAKKHARIDLDHDNALINTMITAGRQYIEGVTGLTLINTIFEYYLDGFPWGCHIELPKNPVSSVTSIKYYDDSNILQTLSPSVYDLDNKGIVAKVSLAYGASYPSTYQKPNAVIIKFTAGYGADGDAVPEQLKLALKAFVTTAMENRESFVTSGSVSKLPHSFDAIMRLNGIPRI